MFGLLPPHIQQPAAGLPDPAKDPKLDLYKMEYEQAADRFENIYKDLWTNFSYMAVLSGAILTFGKDALGVWWAILLACLPLLFWWWATFVPLDKYGGIVARRLEEIETILNRDYGTQLQHFTQFNAAISHEPRLARVKVKMRLLAIGLGLAAVLAVGQLVVSYIQGLHKAAAKPKVELLVTGPAGQVNVSVDAKQLQTFLEKATSSNDTIIHVDVQPPVKSTAQSSGLLPNRTERRSGARTRRTPTGAKTPASSRR